MEGVLSIGARGAALAIREGRVSPVELVAACLERIRTLTPTAPSPAPAGLGSTGDAWFCAPWSSAGVPAITLPSGLSSSGLPFAVQLVAAAGREAALLGTAAWCERVLDFSHAPRV